MDRTSRAMNDPTHGADWEPQRKRSGRRQKTGCASRTTIEVVGVLRDPFWLRSGVGGTSAQRWLLWDSSYSVITAESPRLESGRWDLPSNRPRAPRRDARLRGRYRVRSARVDLAPNT